MLHTFVLRRGKPFLCQVWVLAGKKNVCVWVCICVCRIITGIQPQLANDTNCPDLLDACDAARSLSLLPYPLQGFLKCSIWILVSGKDPALGPIWQMRSCAASAPADWASLSQSLSLLVSSYCCETSFSSLCHWGSSICSSIGCRLCLLFFPLCSKSVV